MAAATQTESQIISSFLIRDDRETRKTKSSSSSSRRRKEKKKKKARQQQQQWKEKDNEREREIERERKEEEEKRNPTRCSSARNESEQCSWPANIIRWNISLIAPFACCYQSNFFCN